MSGNIRFSVKNLMALCCLLIGLTAAVSYGPAHADESAIPEPFRGASPGSPIRIDYGDWDRILRMTVLDARSRTRDGARPPVAAVGTRILQGNTKDTRNEGNRLIFQAFADHPGNTKVLHKIRTELEAVPTEAPLRLWDKHEQLAYWLNLYNITLVELLAVEYPVKSLKKLKYGRHSLWERKVLKVAGIPLSLTDIHRIVVNKWDNTMVMYGFFQGYVGGPSLMNRAFTGRQVIRQLVRNGEEFVATSRGLRFKGGTLVVSRFYKENKALFPDWKPDLEKHLAALASYDDRRRILAATRISARTTDYYIADLNGGTRATGTSVNANPAALDDAVVHVVGGGNVTTMTLGQYADFKAYDTPARVPSFVKDYMAQVHKNKRLLKGHVNVEEYEKTGKDSQTDKKAPSSTGD